MARVTFPPILGRPGDGTTSCRTRPCPGVSGNISTILFLCGGRQVAVDLIRFKPRLPIRRPMAGMPGERDIRGRMALVTGAGKRLGKAIALGLAAEGAGVVIHYHSSADAAESVAAGIRASGGRAWTVRGDLADPAAVERILADAMDRAGPIDLLVNSAGIFPESTLESVTFDDFAASARVNAWAPLALSRAFARALDGRGGRVVNLVDTRVDGHDPGHIGYILSKHVLAAATTILARELAPRVTVNAVSPGAVLPPVDGADHDYLARIGQTLPLKREGSAADIVDTVLFLLKAPFITGETIHVDGGAHLGVERS